MVKYINVLFCLFGILSGNVAQENPTENPPWQSFEDFQGLAEIRVAQEW